LTIAFITGRTTPHLDWLLESLAPQIEAGDKINVLVIDAQGRTPEQLGARSYGDWTPSVRVALPKPTPWQGAHRITSRDWWAKSSAINTALVLCDTDYVAFLDDCCRLGPEWLRTVRRGDRKRDAVLAGTYDKIEGGVVTPDHRRVLAPGGKLNCGGGWLFGCTFALPLEWALEANGAEEGCDGMGTEDYILGFMLENNGHRIDFVPSMAVTQERVEVSVPGIPSIGLRRTDKGVSPNDKSHFALARFRVRKRTEFTPDLRALRAARVAGNLSWPMPDPDLRDWFDGQLVREMV
jgi:glycosyltransferase involved in cell wall biosynthesis